MDDEEYDLGEITATPLCWPVDIPRNTRPVKSSFRMSMPRARDLIASEMKQIGVCHWVISSDIPTRRDGLPYANYLEPADHGAAVWYVLDGETICQPGDHYDSVLSNLIAIGNSLKAIRSLERWNTHAVARRARHGFVAKLTHEKPLDWRRVLGVEPGDSWGVIRSKYLKLAALYHPDKNGGDSEKMAYINLAYELAKDSR